MKLDKSNYHRCTWPDTQFHQSLFVCVYPQGVKTSVNGIYLLATTPGSHMHANVLCLPSNSDHMHACILWSPKNELILHQFNLESVCGQLYHP